MKTLFNSAIGLITLVIVLIPSGVEAYAGSINYVLERGGEHPYEIRRNNYETRKDEQEFYEDHRWLYPIDYYIYNHPSNAERSSLHPFYRQGGISYSPGFYPVFLCNRETRPKA